MWNWFYRLGAPKSFYAMTSVWLPWIGAVTLGLLAVGLVWSLLYVPADYQQGDAVRIMYVHVPASILSQAVYIIMAAAAIVYLIWRIKLAAIAMYCAVPIGASLTLLALLTGSIWGKPMWGTWWVWDARLTSTLILFFLYVGIMSLGAAMENRASTAKAVSILAVVGLINLPIIKFSVNWWNTLHQPASFSLTEKPAMPAEMYLPLLVMLVGFYLLFVYVWISRMQIEILISEYKSQWVKNLVLGEGRHAV